MSLRTRLDCRSEKNDRFTICDVNGNVYAEVVTKTPNTEVVVSTIPTLHIEKPSGHKSKGSR